MNTEKFDGNTIEELTEYIEGQVAGPDEGHDYNTCPDAVARAAYAAYVYVNRKLGTTGFQASHADLMFLGMARLMEDRPFAIIDSEHMLFPQYNIPGDVNELLGSWGQWAADEARNKMQEYEDKRAAAEAGGFDFFPPHPNVMAHWRRLAAAYPPEDENEVLGAFAKDVWNWYEAFAYAGQQESYYEHGSGTYGSPNLRGSLPNKDYDLTPFGILDVKIVYAAAEGENDGESWLCIGELKDGRHFVLEASCDYTGWDCQAGGEAVIARSFGEAQRFGLGKGQRQRLGLQLMEDFNDE